MLSRIIVAALLTASAIFAAVRIYWPDIIAQPASAAAFLGALAGAGGGLLAIIFGAVINAELNRRRDDRLRGEQARTLAVALRAELSTLMAEAASRVSSVESLRATDGPVNPAQVVHLDIPAKKVFGSNTHHLGDLGDRAAIAVIAAHAGSDEIRSDIAGARAHASDDFIDDNNLEVFARNFRNLFEAAAKGINALNAFLGEAASFPDPGSVLDQALAAHASEPGPRVSTK